MSPRRRLLAVPVTALLLCSASCTSHASRQGAGSGGHSSSHSSTHAPSASQSTHAAGGPVPLARTRLAPGVVGSPAAGLHCHLKGTTPQTYRPDPACTPGAVDDTVTQNNIDTTICVSGYTTKIRPSSSATNKVKAVMYTAYSVPDDTTSELDHLVSLELGGSNDSRNLWAEPGKIPNPKDTVENALHKAVCDHKVTLAAAQQAIATDWTTALTVTGVGK